MASNADYAAIGSRTLMDQGLAKARGQEISGQLWGETISRLGDLVPKQVRQTMQEAAQRRAHATMMQIIQDAGGDLEKALPGLMQFDPILGSEVAETVAKSKRSAFEMQTAEWEFKNKQADWANRTLVNANNQQEWTGALMAVKGAGQPIDKYPQQWTPELKQQLLQGMLSYKEQLELSKPKPPEVDLQETVNDQGQRVRRAVPRVAGTETLMPPETPEQIFVTRGGVPTPIPKGTAQPGDVPYAASAGSGGSDYATFLKRWAAEHGTTPEAMTATQELQAREKYGRADNAAIRPFAPIVIQTADGPQILDREPGTTRPITGPTGETVKPPPTADMRNKAEGRRLVATSIAAIEELSKKVITKRGIAQRATAAGRSIESALGNDPEYRVYQDARMALAGNLAVGQQGSRPSDADIRAIWLPLVPDAFRDTDESAAMKWQLIKTMSNAEASAPPSAGGNLGPYKFVEVP